MQIDIMPTVLNLFGIDFTKSFIIGHDIFNNKYPSVAIFKNKTYYDGTYYYNNWSSYIKDDEGNSFHPANHTNDDLQKYVDEIIRKNDMVVTKNYFKCLDSKSQ